MYSIADPRITGTTNSQRYDGLIFSCDRLLGDWEKVANTELARVLYELELINEPELNVSLDDTLRDSVKQSMETRLRTRRLKSALSKIDLSVCLASSRNREKTLVTLRLSGLLDQFDGQLFFSTGAKRDKPFPDLFSYVARELGFAANRCAVLEDSLAGVQAGVAAGMDVYSCSELGDPEELSAAGAFIFEDLALLPDLLRLD